MRESHKILTICELLKGNYKIPLYQRNFAWSYDEIEQLVQDVEDARREEKENYYIGTLVIDKDYNIIDGQQRSTALTLIILALQREYHNELTGSLISKSPISFSARQKSNDTLEGLFVGKFPDQHNEISLGYLNARDSLKQIEDIVGFTDYLLHKVIIFQSKLPDHLDLNLYFERFNSRGEQLEAHEVIKAQMMAKLDNEKAQKFAKIWEACSELDIPVIKFFKKKSKHTDTDCEREKIFPVTGTGYYTFKNLLKLNLSDDLTEVEYNSEKKVSIRDSLVSGTDFKKRDSKFNDDEEIRYRTVINFETFLYYVYYITVGEDSDIQLDDKKLLFVFEQQLQDDNRVDFISRYARNMLQLKFIFDNCIIRSSLETTGDGRRREDKWFLQKVYRVDVNQKSRGHRYVQYRFDKNSFEYHNEDILMLQSMFAVTFTSNRDSHWLYEIMSFLYHYVNENELDEKEFSKKFFDKLEHMAIQYARNRIFSDKTCSTIKSYLENIPVYAFNFIDYVLWKNRSELKERFFDVEHFRFSYRRSIEHWYPQNPSEDLEKVVLDDVTLHSVGNLAIITNSQNSKFSNLSPISKYNEWEGIFNRQSLKLQWMAKITCANDSNWNKETIHSFEQEICGLVTQFIGNQGNNNQWAHNG